MLHESAVTVELLETLRDLQASLAGTGFALAGGTSLALRLGHRRSVDLDFFTVAHFDPAALASHLGRGPESITGMADGSLQLRINQIKVEFLKHAYPKVADDTLIHGINMWSLEDVAAMKLNAISNRGGKKDFHDLAALLAHFPLQTMIGFYQQKYQPASLMMVIRSLAWFDDAEAEPDPISFHNTPWNTIVDTISSAIRSLD